MERYTDWRAEVAANYETRGPIPEHPYFEPGLWIDSGWQTADDANREVIELARSWGLAIPEDIEPALSESGWSTEPEYGEWLIDFADYTATPFLVDVVSAYGFDPNENRDHWVTYFGLEDELHPEHPLTWWIGFDGDIGGFGLWVEPDDEWREPSHEFTRAWFTGNVVCSRCGLMPFEDDAATVQCVARDLTTNRFSILAIILAIILATFVDGGTINAPTFEVDPETDIGTALTIDPETFPVCFEDETKVMIVSEVLPDNRTGPGLDWGNAGNVGRIVCAATDNIGFDR